MVSDRVDVMTIRLLAANRQTFPRKMIVCRRVCGVVEVDFPVPDKPLKIRVRRYIELFSSA